MKAPLLLTILVLVASSNLVSAQKTERDLTRLSGTYTFNFSDTDEDATVTVRFRKNKEAGAITVWLADGKMEDRVRKRTVTFSGAYVALEPNGIVVVDAEFVRFKLSGKRLDWLPAYKHPLFNDPG